MNSPAHIATVRVHGKANHNGAPVSSIDDLRSAVEKSKNHIALLVQRGDNRLFVPVRVG